jgi:hypothetical protein
LSSSDFIHKNKGKNELLEDAHLTFFVEFLAFWAIEVDFSC